MDNIAKPDPRVENDLEPTSVQNDKPSTWKESRVDSLCNSAEVQSSSHNKENFQIPINSNKALLADNSSKDKICNVVKENMQKSSKRSLPVDEWLSETMQGPVQKPASKRTANLDRNSQLLQRFSSFIDEDFEDFGDDLRTSDKTNVALNKELSSSNKKNHFEKQAVNRANLDILELFNLSNVMDHPSPLDSTLQGMKGLNNSILNSSTGSTTCSSKLHQQEDSLMNEKHSQKISEMCNAQNFLAAVDASQKSRLSNTDPCLIDSEAEINLANKNDFRESAAFESNVPPMLTNFRGSFQSTSGPPKLLSKDNAVCRQENPSPEVIMHNLLQYPGSLSDIGGSSTHDSMRPPVQKGSTDDRTKLSSEVCAQFTVPSKAVKPKFPGPAGLLPNLDTLEGSNLALASRMLSAIQDSGSKKDSGGEALPSLTLGPLWSSMLQDLDIHPSCLNSPLRRHNIERSVLRQHGGSNSAVGCGGLRRVPMLVVQVNAVQPAHSQATLLLSDHTGEVSGLLSTSGVSTYLGNLTAGCVMLLTSVTVWHRAPARPPLLTITADNIAALYSPVRRLPPAAGQTNQINRSIGKDGESDVFDVKITSGLTMEERRQLKDKIGIDTILERSLVEEDCDFKVRSVKPSESCVGVERAIGANAPNVVNRNRVNVTRSWGQPAAPTSSVSSNFRPPAPSGSHPRPLATSWNRAQHSPSLRPGCSTGTVSGTFKPTSYPLPSRSTMVNNSTVNTSCVPTACASTTKSGFINANYGKPTFVNNVAARSSLCASTTSPATLNISTSVNIKHVTPMHAGSGPRFHFSPIVPRASAVQDSGVRQQTTPNSCRASTPSQSPMSARGGVSSQTNIPTHVSTSAQSATFSKAKSSMLNYEFSAHSSTPSRPSYCLSVNRPKQFTYKSGASSISSCRTDNSKNRVTPSSTCQPLGGGTSKSIMTHSAGRSSGQGESASTVSNVISGSSSNCGADLPTEREFREIRELMATFTECDFDDF